MALSRVLLAAVVRSVSSPVPCLAASTRICWLSRCRRIRRIRTASLTQRGGIEKPGGRCPRDYSFYDRLHSNIARCVMLTRQHRSLKHRESPPSCERVQGERTSVPSSGVDADPCAIAHRGGMALRAADAVLAPTRGARALSPNSNVRDHAAAPRLKAARRALSFNHQEWNWEGMT